MLAEHKPHAAPRAASSASLSTAGSTSSRVKRIVENSTAGLLV